MCTNVSFDTRLMASNTYAQLGKQSGSKSGNREPNIVPTDTNSPVPGPAMSQEIASELELNSYSNIEDTFDNDSGPMVEWAASDSTCLMSASSETASLPPWTEPQDLDADLTIPETMSMTTQPRELGCLQFSDLIWADLCANAMS